jgi:hypothetical protein
MNVLGFSLLPRIALPALLGLLLAAPAGAQTAIAVTTGADLVNALTTVDSNPNTSFTLNFTGSIGLGAANTLPAIVTAGSVTINGQGNTLDGGGVQRGFFVYSGTVTIQNQTIQNTLAQGGSGSAGGGGGLGAGGGLFVGPGANVTLNTVNLGVTGNPNKAVGGNGAASTTSGGVSGGAGGGLSGGAGAIGGLGGAGGGNGIAATSGLPGGTNGFGPNNLTSGGGGAGGAGANSGGTGSSGSGGAGGNGSGLPAGVVGFGGNGGGGGGGGFGGGGGGGGLGGGGGGSGGGGGAGGNGGFGGGGGGGGAAGGGNASGSFAGAGGTGGFGGGGGGGSVGFSGSESAPGAGGFGAGAGGFGGGGGGGLGAGGAIFVVGGTLTLAGPLTISGNTVAGGSSAAGNAGLAFGSGIFLAGSDANNGGSGLLTFSPAAGQTQTVSDVIGDQAGNGGNIGSWGLAMNGAGVLNLRGSNFFSGAVAVNSGTLGVNNVGGLATGTGPVTVASGATLAGTGAIANLTLQAGSFFAPGSGIGTLSVVGGTGVIWKAGAEGLYTLGTGNTSSTLVLTNLGSALTKSGTGPFLFSFQNTGTAGSVYTLATFASTTFSPSDFTYTGLPAGLTGTFTISGGTKLLFTVVSTVPAGAAPVITSASAASGTQGNTFNYSIVATGSPTSYALLSGTLPTGLSLNPNTGIISGTPTQTGVFSLTIGATNAGGTGLASLTITITLPTPVSITSQPVSGAVLAGTPFTFSVTAAGTAPLTYQWFKGGTAIAGATSSTLAIASTAGTDAGSYTVVASNLSSSATSIPAVLTVTVVAPAITTQPQSQTVTVGSSFSFTVAATGVPTPAYQWFFGGVAISGATSATYSVASAAASNAGSYTVVATNSAGNATGSATLTVNPAPAAPAPAPAPGGGGGAPSFWFYGALALVLAVRQRLRRASSASSF